MSYGRSASAAREPKRIRIVILGAVQGLGFRPFIYRLARRFGLAGFVINTGGGVRIEAEGPEEELFSFLLSIPREKPAHAFIQSLEHTVLDVSGYQRFEILESDAGGEKTALILPDIATCPDCLQEIFDPTDRRYHYPFTNCTRCGPRFSIVEALPYDRARTTMRRFDMCPDCRREYEDPDNRRFHAEPNACPACGPQLEWRAPGGPIGLFRGQALERAVAFLRSGKIVAVKGLGGFQLMVDAENGKAIRELRQRKHREEKPFALMFPDLDTVKEVCEVSDLEARLLLSPESPIVLLERKWRRLETRSLCLPDIAPGNPYVGVMLPYTPLHHLLMRELAFPLVATSGNISEEPILTDEADALRKLGAVADGFLIHNRPIARHVDDSIVRVTAGRELVLRRARGFAPLPVFIKMDGGSFLGVGPQLKNTVAFSKGARVFVSQHIGDLENEESEQVFRRVIADFENLYELRPRAVICDKHPAYLSGVFAAKSSLPVFRIQHHHAHILSCMAENELDGNVLGVAWDGTGFGDDGSIWGGEFLLVNGPVWKRLARLRPFLLPGGEQAVREPRRSLAGVLFEMAGEEIFFRFPRLREKLKFRKEEGILIRQMLMQKINAPLTSSAGRLFDAVASLLDVRQVAKFEGEAAMALEYCAYEAEEEESYPFRIQQEGLDGSSGGQAQALGYTIDWEPMMLAMLKDVECAVGRGFLARKFHNTLVEMIVEVARVSGEEKVVLSGGCFQNKLLTERAVARLREEGFKPYWHQRIPPNDGGISLGQVYGALLGAGAEKPEKESPARPLQRVAG